MKRSFLTGLGLDDDVVSKIMDMNGVDIEREKAVVESIKDDNKNLKLEISDMKKDGKDISGFESQIEELQGKIKQMEADHGTEISAKDKEFTDYKTGIETEKVTTAKQTALRKHLIDSGAVDDELILDALSGKFDLSKLELDDSNAFKGWDDTLKPIKEQNVKHFTAQEQQPALPNGVRLMQLDGAKAAGGNPDPFLVGFDGD